MYLFLKDIVNIISGGTPKTSVPNYWNGSIPWISIKDFNTDNIYIDTTEKSITKLGLENSSTNLLLENDIIISARGTVGCLGIIKEEMAFNQSCYGLRVKNTNQVNSKYLFWFLKNTMNLLKSKTHGSVFDTIIKSDLENFQVFLPNLKIQNRIAKILDDITKKYKDKNDEAAQKMKAQEMMAIYQKNKINPLSSCLLSFVQIPLLFAYLEAINRTPVIFENKFLGLDMGTTISSGIMSDKWHIYILFLAIILGTTYLSFKKTLKDQTAMAAQMKGTIYFMLAMILIASFSLPVALGLYWISSSVFTIIQNKMVERKKEKK